MEKIEKDLKNISSIDTPPKMHQSIMQIIYHKKLLPVLYFIFFILICNFVLLFWHINTKLLEVEFIDMTIDFWRVFNTSFDFFFNLITNFFEVISFYLVFSVLVSFIGLLYILKKIKQYTFE